MLRQHLIVQIHLLKQIRRFWRRGCIRKEKERSAKMLSWFNERGKYKTGSGDLPAVGDAERDKKDLDSRGVRGGGKATVDGGGHYLYYWGGKLERGSLKVSVQKPNSRLGCLRRYKESKTSVHGAGGGLSLRVGERE